MSQLLMYQRVHLCANLLWFDLASDSQKSERREEWQQNRLAYSQAAYNSDIELAESCNGSDRPSGDWIPAFAGMTPQPSCPRRRAPKQMHVSELRASCVYSRSSTSAVLRYRSAELARIATIILSLCSGRAATLSAAQTAAPLLIPAGMPSC